MAAAPMPAMARNPVASGRVKDCARARMAAASGCSDCASTAAASASASASEPRTTSTRTTTGWPSVRVPVLSNATRRTPSSRCNASPLRNRIPSSAARPVPTRMETGVANPMAQGQAMISTETPATSACAMPCPNASQTARVSAANPITTGTNHKVTRSTSACTGSLPPCASATSAMMRASTVAAADRAHLHHQAAKRRSPCPPVSASRHRSFATAAKARRSACFHRGIGTHPDGHRAIDRASARPDAPAQGPPEPAALEIGTSTQSPSGDTRRKARFSAANATSRAIAAPARPSAPAPQALRPKRIKSHDHRGCLKIDRAAGREVSRPGAKVTRRRP